MVKNILENLIEIVCIQREKAEENLSCLPAGSLIIRNKRGRKYYSIYLDGSEKGITNNRELVKKLIEKSNILNDIHYLNVVDSTLNLALSKIPAKNYKMSYGEEWENEKFEANPYKTGSLKYQTNHGEFVRSKSEKIIADALHSMSIPFRYEAALLVDNQTYYPDFQILKPNGEIVVWEHLGLMEKQEYYINSILKIINYRKSGYFLHKNLICTWEEDLFDASEIKRIIEKFILC